jgi:very-short-patch-repair endonuclease
VLGTRISRTQPHLVSVWRSPQRRLKRYGIPIDVDKPPSREERVIAIARLIARQYGLITRDQARLLGMSDDAIYRKVSAGLWIRDFPKVFRDVTVPTSWHQRLKALALRRPGRLWVSHRAACAFWQLDGFDPGLVEITTVCDLRAQDGFLVHRVRCMDPRDVTIVANLPVTTVHRTLIDLGLVAHVDEVELALECALRRRITTISRLCSRLDALTTHRGSGVLRKALERRPANAPPTESALETRFLQFVRRHKLPAPDRQVPITDDRGFIGRVDFYYSAARVVVEVQSRRHHLSAAAWERDLRRSNVLTSSGRRVLHVTAEQLKGDANLVAEVAQLLDLPRARRSGR